MTKGICHVALNPNSFDAFVSILLGRRCHADYKS
jgi:hypothetical protein